MQSAFFVFQACHRVRGLDVSQKEEKMHFTPEQRSLANVWLFENHLSLVKVVVAYSRQAVALRILNCVFACAIQGIKMTLLLCRSGVLIFQTVQSLKLFNQLIRGDGVLLLPFIESARNNPALQAPFNLSNHANEADFNII